MDILRKAGAWLARNGQFLPHSSRCPFTWTNVCTLTTRGQMVYAHIFASSGDVCCIAEIANRVKAVHVLATGQPLAFEQSAEKLIIRGLPGPDPIATTLAIAVDGEPRAITPQTTHWIPV